MPDKIKFMNLIDNYIYIYQLEKFCVIPVYPDSISDQMASSFASTNALSRSAPVFTYNNSGPRSLGLSLSLHRDLMEDVNTNVSNLKDGIREDLQNKDYIDLLINYLQAIALPKYSIYTGNSKSVEPPQIAVRLGNDIFIKGVVDSGVTVSYEKPILDNNRYGVVKIDFTIKETDPYDAPTVAQVGGFRGVTATFKNGIYKGEDSDTLVYSLKEFTGKAGGPRTYNDVGTRQRYTPITRGIKSTRRGVNDYKVPEIPKEKPPVDTHDTTILQGYLDNLLNPTPWEGITQDDVISPNTYVIDGGLNGPRDYNGIDSGSLGEDGHYYIDPGRPTKYQGPEAQSGPYM